MKHILNARAFIAALALFVFAACADNAGEADDKGFLTSAHIIKGKIEKGPMISGSSVEMRTLDKDLVPTGNSFTASIENDCGDFNYGPLKVGSPYAKLSASGYFFNEVTGELSSGMIQLDAIVDLSDNTSINVNLLTHLKSRRIAQLVTVGGKSYKTANEQAQRELLTQFGLQRYTSEDASRFSIVSGNDEAGALIAISSLILAERSEAEIVEFLSKLNTEFSTTGAFSDGSKAQLRSARTYLDEHLEEIAQNIVGRYASLGYDVEVKNLACFFDWDDDGIAGNEFEETDSLRLSQNLISAAAAGGKYSITIESEGKYFLTPPASSGEVLPPGNMSEESFFSDFYDPKEVGALSPAQLSYSKEMKGKIIEIEVFPAKFHTTQTASFHLYDARGRVAASIVIRQEGNPDIPSYNAAPPKLGTNGAAAFLGAMRLLRDAYTLKRELEAQYVQQAEKQPYLPNDEKIADCHAKFYAALNNLLRLKAYDADMLNCYQPYFNVYIALTYHALSSHWGGVPFFTEKTELEDLHPLPATPESEVLDSLAQMLEEALPYLEEKKNDAFTDANTLLFVSKDVARILLAYVYCNRQDYAKALPLLETLIAGGYYSIVPNLIAFENNSECIFGFVPETRTRAGESCLPCLDFKDVLLFAAECCHHCGDAGKAQGYLRKVCDEKGITLTQSELLPGIAEALFLFKSSHCLSFLRRNALGESVLGLTPEETYQLLWPVPLNEMYNNTSLVQNPGY